jgi:hypothetical protein
MIWKEAVLMFKPLIASCAMTISAVALSGQAFATGGILCDANDANLKLSVVGTVARAIGQDISSVQGSAVIKFATGERPFDLAGTLVQSWLEGDEARLHFYWNPKDIEGLSGIEIVIKTSGNITDAPKTGTYMVSMFPVSSTGTIRRIEGMASCELD